MATARATVIGPAQAKMYYFTKWVTSPRGRRPQLPASAAFHVVAEGAPDATWCLVATSTGARGATPVTPELDALLTSAEGWPPAIALAGKELSRAAEPNWGPDELSDFLVRRLRRHLRGQTNAPFVLAEVRRTEAGYLRAGTFVWLLALRREMGARGIVVDWVASDYSIYTNPAADFRIPPAARRRLRARDTRAHRTPDR